MGRLGWTETEALDADVNSILIAWEGKIEFINMIFGGGEKTAESKAPVATRVMTPELFAALFG